MRRLALPVVLISTLLAIPFAAQAQSSPKPGEMENMTFELLEKCEEDECELVALGQGRIMKGTTARLQKFMAEHREVRTVFLHSPGGYLAEGLRLGVAIREAGLDTALTPQMRCFSACAYAFLGGVSRQVQPGAILGVHRFYSDQAAGDDDIGDAQRIGAILATYVQGMGLGRDIIDAAATRGGENLYSIDTAEARAMGADNHGVRPATWALVPSDSGPMTLVAKGPSLGNDRNVVVTVAALSRSIAVGVFMREPPFNSPERLKREMKNSTLVVCRHDARGNVRGERCLVGRQVEAWERPRADVLGGMFTVESGAMARLLEGSSDDGVAIVVYGGETGEDMVLMLNTKAEGLRSGIKALFR